MKRIACGLFAVIGLLCVVFPAQITAALPYVLGIVCIVHGAEFIVRMTLSAN